MGSQSGYPLSEKLEHGPMKKTTKEPEEDYIPVWVKDEHIRMARVLETYANQLRTTEEVLAVAIIVCQAEDSLSVHIEGIEETKGVMEETLIKMGELMQSGEFTRAAEMVSDKERTESEEVPAGVVRH